ncbi:hypothetical protein DL95DRAFT_465264 [Leptodontidium sp. 2 PMI_412]|nr:hypothetical protein DL95DRAFT_465264 [Leptodontidium sp. 2 PMI_412]
MASIDRLSRRFLLYSLLFLSLPNKSWQQLPQVLDAGGNTYQATAALVALPVLPTLYYNCAIMPAICSNVQAWLVNNGQALPREFHIQTGNDKNTDKRRNKSCPGSWSRTHTCPEPIGQPATVFGYGVNLNGNPAPQMLTFGNSLMANNPATVPPTVSPFKNEIEGIGTAESSGLAYTCDEFPPASWIEGGSGVPGAISHANTFCAPQGVSCSSKLWKANRDNYHGIAANPYPTTRSEQNWQAAGHSYLTTFFLGMVVPPATGNVGRFVFDTTSIPPVATPNAVIIHFPLSSKTVTKRGLEHVETGFPILPGLEQKLAGQNGTRTMHHQGVEVRFVAAEQTPPPVLPVLAGNVKTD